jgi:hypothetical protein
MKHATLQTYFIKLWELSHKQRLASGRCIDQRSTTVNWGALKRGGTNRTTMDTRSLAGKQIPAPTAPPLVAASQLPMSGDAMVVRCAAALFRAHQLTVVERWAMQRPDAGRCSRKAHTIALTNSSL